MKLAFEVRRSAMGAGRSDEPLIDLGPVLEIGRFVSVSLEPTRRVEALLYAINGGGRLAVAADFNALREGGTGSAGITARRRARFSIAHEIAHSFFYRRDRGLAERAFPSGGDKEERFCNAFAAALLVPPSVIRVLAPTAETVVRVSETFDVSIEVAARSLVEHHVRKPFVRLEYRRSACGAFVRQWSGGPTRLGCGVREVPMRGRELVRVSRAELGERRQRIIVAV